LHTSKIDFFEKDSIAKLLWKFSAPAIVGMIVTATYNLVDRVFVGNGVNTTALTGVTLTFPLIIVLIGFGMMVGIGAAALVSIRLGEKKKDEAEKILGAALAMSIVISILLLIAGYAFMEEILRAFGGDGAALEYAREFSEIFLLGVVFQQIAFSLNNVIRGEGNPKIAMLTMIIGAVINIILNPIFIFGLGLGVRGSALSTVISQTITCIWVVSYFVRGKGYLKLHLKNIRLDRYSIFGIISIGISPFIMQIFSGLIYIFVNNQLAKFGGDLAIAIFGASNSIIMIFYMPIFGLNQGLQPIVGYNYGAQRFDRVRKAYRMAVLLATGICVVGFIIIMLFTSDIIGLFNSYDKALISNGVHAMRILIMAMPLAGYQIVTTSYFQAIGKAGKSVILTLSRNGLIIIPLLYILPNFFLLDGIWMTAPLSDFGSGALALVFFAFEIKRLKTRAVKNKKT